MEFFYHRVKGWFCVITDHINNKAKLKTVQKSF